MGSWHCAIREAGHVSYFYDYWEFYESNLLELWNPKPTRRACASVAIAGALPSAALTIRIRNNMTRWSAMLNPALVGNQEYTIVFSAGNSGSGSQTIGSPGTGKNIITVGAAENVNPFGGSDTNCGIADSGADSANDIISFSSRGPTTDQAQEA